MYSLDLIAVSVQGCTGLKREPNIISEHDSGITKDCLEFETHGMATSLTFKWNSGKPHGSKRFSFGDIFSYNFDNWKTFQWFRLVEELDFMQPSALITMQRHT